MASNILWFQQSFSNADLVDEEAVAAERSCCAPQWRCYAKYVNSQQIFLSFLPASFSGAPQNHFSRSDAHKVQMSTSPCSSNLQMCWRWWCRERRRSLRVKSARRRTLCRAPPAGWRGPSRPSVWPAGCSGAPAADTFHQGPLCFHLRPWWWSRTAGTTGRRKQKLPLQDLVGSTLMSKSVQLRTRFKSGSINFIS